MADQGAMPAPVRAGGRPSLHSVFSAMTAVSHTSDSSSSKKRERHGGGQAGVGVSRASRRPHAPSVHGDAASTISGSKSSRSLASSVWGTGTRRRGGGRSESVPAVVVKDEDGYDVTPKSLLSLKPSVLGGHNLLSELRAESSRGTRTPSDWETRSSFSVGLSIVASDTPSVASTSVASTPRSVHKSTSLSDVGSAAALDREETDINPDEHISIILAETETEWLLSIESCCIDDGSPASDDAKDRNSRYETLLKKNKLGNESLVAREAQTNVPLRKFKDVQVAPPASKDASAMASESDIADCFATESSFQMPSVTASDVPRAREEPVSATEAADSGGTTDGKINTDLMRELAQEPGAWVDVDPTDQLPEAVNARNRAELRALCASDNVLSSLKLLERAVVQNSEHATLRSYKSAISGDAPPSQEVPAPVATPAPAQSVPPGQRPVQAASAAPAKEKPAEGAATATSSAQNLAPPPPPVKALEELWRLKVPGLTDNRNISCVVWSAQESAVDKIAVGYGSFDSRERYRSAGLILVWSTRNICHPEHIIRTQFGVTALAFSARHTSLLAAGMADGALHVYNLARSGAAATTPALTSADSATRHSDPVWDIRWVEQQTETGGTLVSAATDGRVLQWGMRRGLEVKAELMRLNAGPNPARTHGSQGGAGALRYAGALTADFHPFLKSIYVVGTEGGTCHKCSASYSDQYLQTYVGHVGPVLKVRWSPFHPAAFLTAGADWTLRLWDHDRPYPVLSLNLDSGGKGGITEPAAEYPTDVCWSSTSSTVFACVTGKTFQIWDLANSTMDPVHVEKTAERLTGVLFSPKGNIIAAASDAGTLSVYRIVHPALVLQGGKAPDEAAERTKLEAVLDASARQ
eukprot:m51a1_g860 hypothetical protein (871) ;mRNA; r:803059-806135